MPDNRDILTQILERAGVRVTQATGGWQAVEKVREEPPDIVFMDIRMPDIDGVEAMERIWKEHDRSQVRIVALSASVLDHERRQYLDAGFHDFIDKPFRTEAIFDCMARLLGVEYEYTTEDPPSRSEPQPGPAAVPEDLRRRLSRAAGLYAVTELRRCLEELAALGDEGQLLSTAIGQLVDDYDMEGITRLLEQADMPGVEPG